MDYLLIAMNFAAGFAVAISIASIAEWTIHRFVCHSKSGWFRTISAVHLAHHRDPNWGYNHGFRGVRRFSIFLRFVIEGDSLIGMKAHLERFLIYGIVGAALICTPIWLFNASATVLSGSIIGTVLFALLSISVHDVIHDPKGLDNLPQRRLLRFIAERHDRHHRDATQNLNLVVPLGDWIFGTFSRRGWKLQAKSIDRKL